MDRIPQRGVSARAQSEVKMKDIAPGEWLPEDASGEALPGASGKSGLLRGERYPDAERLRHVRWEAPSRHG
jgi:hypothetical protein